MLRASLKPHWLLAIALYWATSGPALADGALDERGQPIVPARVEMMWTPLAPCGWTLSLQSQMPLGQLISLRATNGTDGYRITPALPRLLFLPSNSTVFAADLACTGDTAPDDFQGITWHQNWSPPPGEARHSDAAVYLLPFATGTLVTVSQDAYGTFTHYNERARAYAIDFPAPEGTAIHAARRGRVVLVEQRFHLGGVDDENYYGLRGNQVVVEHDDGTYAQYDHLRHRGAAVAVGQTVRAGDLIGYVGSTGISEGPHLHFSVNRPLVDGTPQPLVPQFKVRESRRPVELKAGDRYRVVE